MMEYPAPGLEPFNADPKDMESAWRGDLKPIETVYRGFRCRSRLEARWMVFFDSMGIEFLYEPEGFELPGGIRYLPDFWFPKISFWGEVKPFSVTREEREKIKLLVFASDRPVMVLIGPPDFIPYHAWSQLGPEPGDLLDQLYSLDIHNGLDYYFDENRLFSDPSEEGLLEHECSKRYRDSVLAARAARFERGA